MAILVPWFRFQHRKDSLSSVSYNCLHWKEVTAKLEMFVLQITASCTLHRGKHHSMWCKTVCVLPLLSHSLLWCGVSHKLYSVCLHAPFVVFSIVWCCLQCSCGVWMVCPTLSLVCFCMLIVFFLFGCSLWLLLFFLIPDWEFTSFLCSLLFKAVFLFVEVSLCAFCPPLIVVSLVVFMSIWLVFVVVCCVTDASQPYTHTTAKFPHTGNQSSPAALWQSFWTYFSLFFYRLHFSPHFF